MTNGPDKSRERAGGFGGEVDPQVAWEALASDPGSVLLDVRTAEEWRDVGAPDLSGIGKATFFVSWVVGPDRRPNAQFLEEIETALSAAKAEGGDEPTDVYIICRSGARSLSAAHAIAGSPLGAHLRTINVGEGFEGRDARTGWRTRGLPSSKA